MVLLLHCLGVAPERGGATDGDVDGAPSSHVCVRARATPALCSLSWRVLAHRPVISLLEAPEGPYEL